MRGVTTERERRAAVRKRRLAPRPRGALRKRRDRLWKRRVRQTVSRRAPDAVVLVLLAAAVAGMLVLIGRTSGPDGMSGPANSPGPAQRRASTTAVFRPTARALHARAPRVSAAAPAKTIAPAVTHVVVDAARAPSWVVARAGSATGKVLYAGTLPKGRTIRVAAPRVFLRLGSAGSVDVTVNGRPLRHALTGTVDALLTKAGLARP